MSRVKWCGREKCQFFSLPTAYGKGEGDSGALKPKGKFPPPPHLASTASLTNE